MATHQLDATGLLCPLPVLRARKALAALRPGERLEVAATDPSAEKDFAAFCDASGNNLVEMRRKESVLFFLIEKR